MAIDPKSQGPTQGGGRTEVESLGAKVRRLRIERRLPQDKLALQANVDQSGLSKFERATGRGFGPLPLGRIAAVLGLSLEQLVSGTDYSNGSDLA